MFIPLFFTALIADLAGNIFLWTLEFIKTISYTKSPAVNTGWPIVRDLANMIIVLGFVVIGIATALRIREYEAKQLLAKLIVIALLVNFSLLLCGIIIDGTNIVMTSFFNLVTVEVGSIPFAGDNIANSWACLLYTSPSPRDS